MSCGLWSSPSRAAAGSVLFPGNPRGILLLGLRVALLPLLRLDLAIDLQFLVGVGGASRLAICRLQLVGDVIDIRFKPRRSLQMLNGLILVARVQLQVQESPQTGAPDGSAPHPRSDGPGPCWDPTRSPCGSSARHLRNRPPEYIRRRQSSTSLSAAAAR